MKTKREMRLFPAPGPNTWEVSKWASHRGKEFTEEVYSRWLPDAAHVEEGNRGP